MLLVALVPGPSDPSIAAQAYAAILGEGWTVHAFADESEISPALAASMEYLVAAAPRTVSAGLLARAKNLRLVQVPGHGFDHIDLAAARAEGIPVASVASSGAEAHTVAEMALLLAGVASRRVLHGDRIVRDGGWGQMGMLQHGVFELAGKTLGIVGLGRIGLELAKRATAFDMRVCYSDVVPVSSVYELLPFDALLSRSDIISLHLPLTPETQHIIDERAISLMKPAAVLVNTARGPLVDAAALASALRAGRVRAAAIDVYDAEPPSAGYALLGLDNVVLSPHMAGVTAESVMRILAAALENCRRVARNEKPLDVIA